MEQHRLFLAVLLSFLVFIVWEMFFVEHEEIKQQKQSEEIEQTINEEPYVKTVKDVNVEEEESPSRISRIITVNSPLYSVQISEKKAVFKSFVLKDYKESTDENSALKEIISSSDDCETLELGFAQNSISGLENAIFTANVPSDVVNVYDASKEITFSWTSPQGVIIEKKFLFLPETYIIKFAVVVKNGSPFPIKDSLLLSLVMTYPEKTGYAFEGPSALIDNELNQVKAKKIKDKNVYAGKIKWMTVQNRYFMSCIIPQDFANASMRLFLKQDDILQAQFMGAEYAINPETQHIYEYNLFFGPKRIKILQTLDCDLDKAVDFGMFDFIAKPCLWFMNFLHDNLISNFGVSIIILTTLIKIVLWPLGTKSYKSINEMKKVQPLMAEIRAKNKDDKKKMNEEIMALYKTYKINPLGGCLPMICQIPVFFALYRMLYEAIELRHAPFVGWITDLSAPDRLFNFGFSIPFMDPPHGVPVLTIIMGATMLLQQKMSPPPGDPAQAKMMMLMPIVFTVIFINFSSGLVLYWLVNNILSISQQYYISKKAAQ